jgi:hypothetical protein
MTATALRSIDCTAADTGPLNAREHSMHEHNQDLLQRIGQLERELRQRATTITTLRRELTRAVSAPTVVGERVVDGMLTCTLSSGAVVQRRPRVVETPTEFSYGFAWVLIEPVVGTAAEIVDAVFADDETEPAHYMTAQQALLRARTLGMAVTAGDVA